ncbi:MAG: hypothetical protein AAF957_00320 [Planctomycetota bacterium]
MHRARTRSTRRSPRGVARRAPLLLGATLLVALSSCASLKVDRDTETSGTFRSSARVFTFLGWDIPRRASQVAHENASDASLPNMRPTKVRATDWGWFHWILEILSTSSASVEGTWGYQGGETVPERVLPD